MDESTREFWNESYREDPAGTIVRDVILEEELRDMTPGTALDLGCGTGENAIRLAKSGWQVTGIDISDIAIDSAKRTAAGLHLPVEFHSADVTEWQPDKTFDLVYSTYALPDKPLRSQALQVMVKALKSRGTLLIVEWDASMSDIWGFAPGYLPSKTELLGALTGVDIEKAEVRHIENIFDAGDMRAETGRNANVLLIRTRKP